MPKDFKLTNLFKDLEYILYGTEPYAFLTRLFPPREGAIVLEPGCGCGKFGLSYALQGCEVILLDYDPEVVKYARRLRGALNALLDFPLPVLIKVGNIHRMRFAPSTFDLVFNEGVPQHWTTDAHRQAAIDNMARVSRDMVIVMGNNGANPQQVKEDDTATFTYKGMMPKRKCFTPEELEMRLKRAGLKNVGVEPVTPGPIENSYLLAGWGKVGAG